MRKKNKKAVVEIQFSWIFILIAGSVILLFFVSIAGKYKSAQDNLLAAETLVRLSSIATAGQMSSNSNSVTELPRTEIDILCYPDLCNENGCPTDFNFKKSNVEKPAWMEIDSFFSSSLIKDDDLIMWSLEWFMPYKITNVLYLSSTNQKYILVYDSSGEEFANFTYDKLKDNKYTKIEKISYSGFSNYQHSGEYSARFIFFGNVNDQSLPDSFKKATRKSVLKVSVPTDEDYSYGEVTFCKVDELTIDCSGYSVNYFGFPMLVGAIFSDNEDNYKCNVHKMFIKYEIISKIYENKAEDLSITGKNDCLLIYDNLKNEIGLLNYQNIGFNDLKENINEISSLNSQLQISDCARLY
jgi:hypothetical protein